MIRIHPIAVLVLTLFLAHCSSSKTVTTTTQTDPVVEAEPTPTAQEEPEAEPKTEAEQAPPNDWYHLDETQNGLRGVSTTLAYRTLLNGREPAQTVVVAVIDSGVDIEHEDLQGKIWTNTDEVEGNGVDDDQNGYVDDVYGWNFLGGADGESYRYDTYEVTREYARLKAKYGDKSVSEIPDEDGDEYSYYQTIREAYETESQQDQEQYVNISSFRVAAERADAVLKEHLNTDIITPENLARADDTDPDVSAAKGIYTFLFDNNVTLEDLIEYHEHLEVSVQYRYNIEYDPRSIVGDDYSDPTERIYGNNDVDGLFPNHGTHVSGIIAADRDNGIGSMGVADAVQIMPIRVVPDGDERDKDVANAIRYAVDNGARVVNMSFGKSYSPQKEVVDEAVRYAEANNVLLVHGAGNDGADIDVENNFPNPVYLDGGKARNWIEVGATAWAKGPEYVASFSNYGKHSVDLFAPGVSVYSTLPDHSYGPQDGTSMASPVVAGIAALLMAYYPELTAVQVREILLDTATRYAGELVMKPGQPDQMVDFGELSRTGGQVNAVAALRRAESIVNHSN